MYLEDDQGEPYVVLHGVQYMPPSGEHRKSPREIELKITRDSKGREGVFVPSFSRGGMCPVAHVTHKVEGALRFGWPELSHKGYSIDHHYHDEFNRDRKFRAGYENLMGLPILMGILELEGKADITSRHDAFYGALVIDEETKEIKVEVPEDIDIEFRYYLRNLMWRSFSSKEMPIVPIPCNSNRISNEAAAILSEKTPERFMRSLLDSKILRDGASAADVAALMSGLDSLLGHGVAGTENLKKSLDMRERSTRH